MSNVTLDGFADARKGDEWVHPAAFGEQDDKGMARLPVEEAPVYDGEGKTSSCTPSMAAAAR